MNQTKRINHRVNFFVPCMENYLENHWNKESVENWELIYSIGISIIEIKKLIQKGKGEVEEAQKQGISIIEIEIQVCDSDLMCCTLHYIQTQRQVDGCYVLYGVQNCTVSMLLLVLSI